jgi:small neutral amino acid transporter SnatA (MarC family)
MLHAKEIKDASKREDVSICPLAMLLLTDPATVTTVVVLIKTGETLELKTIVILAILLTFIVSIAVEFIATGVWNIYQSMG